MLWSRFQLNGPVGRLFAQIFFAYSVHSFGTTIVIVAPKQPPADVLNLYFLPVYIFWLGFQMRLDVGDERFDFNFVGREFDFFAVAEGVTEFGVQPSDFRAGRLEAAPVAGDLAQRVFPLFYSA